MKSLENFSVQEMNTTEMKDINGGGFFFILGVVALATYLGHRVISNARSKNRRNSSPESSPTSVVRRR